ncbi:hypothetical protein TSUD_260910 [Trifolium subterraneum]|uniref:Uncharacterized protein n=1 Tax=Trifolium subterraneum TaxID=3900 RepID=A0A2Z6LSR0_TRISU|nr:hypothetical protein TSUD_260910 [Trifolium subterraneum]
MERNCLETMDRDFKVRLWPSKNLNMHSHNSSCGKYEQHAAACASAAILLFVVLAIFLFGTLDLDDEAAISIVTGFV